MEVVDGGTRLYPGRSHCLLFAWPPREDCLTPARGPVGTLPNVIRGEVWGEPPRPADGNCDRDITGEVAAGPNVGEVVAKLSW